jgi:hypothetical protein
VDISSELLAQLLLALAHRAQLLGAGPAGLERRGQQQEAGFLVEAGEQQAWGQQRQQGGGGAAGQQDGQQEAGFLVDGLEGLTGAGRFELNVRLLGSKNKAAVQQLFWDLDALAASGDAAAGAELQARLARLQQLYGVAAN